MTAHSDPFEIQTPGLFLGAYLGEVVAVDDRSGPPRVEVRLYCCDGVEDQDGPVWARIAVPCAGDNRGTFFVPDVGDEVLVAFLHGDPRFPVVLGALWNGGTTAPERLGGDGKRVDRWTIVGRRSSRIAIVEDKPGEATIALSTPGNVSLTLTEKAGGSIELKAGGCTIKLDSQGIQIQTGNKVVVKGSRMEVTAGQVKVTSAMADFSGVVKAMLVQSQTVAGQAYLPGMGNVW
ncbi:MAG: phage baseplate assembly protein V [Gemmatimonadales bacterium]